eukprot:g3387.t1
MQSWGRLLRTHVCRTFYISSNAFDCSRLAELGGLKFLTSLNFGGCSSLQLQHFTGLVCSSVLCVHVCCTFAEHPEIDRLSFDTRPRLGCDLSSRNAHPKALTRKNLYLRFSCLRGLPLEELNLYDIRVPLTDLKPLRCLTTLSDLNLSFNYFHDSILFGLRGLKLIDLDLSGNENLTDAGMAVLAVSLPTLTGLSISSCERFTDDGCHALRSLALKNFRYYGTNITRSATACDCTNDTEWHLILLKHTQYVDEYPEIFSPSTVKYYDLTDFC